MSLPESSRRRVVVAALAVACAGLMAGVVVGATAARAADFDLSLSGHYSSGDYGGSGNVEIYYAPAVFKVEHRAWMLKLVVPWLRISGGNTVVEGPNGPIVTPNGTAEGLGDIVVEGTYTISPTSPYMPFVEIGGRVKIPTASESEGLGTGKFDFIPEVELSRTWGRWTPYLSVGYRVLGEPSGIDYADGFLASVGVTYRVTRPLEPGVFVYWKQSATSGSPDSAEALPALRIHIGNDWLIDTYVSAGFTDSSPDVGTGLQVHYLFEAWG
jgi:hypothetical protein